jgi:membrane protease YdiL (CAAX protease family)
MLDPIVGPLNAIDLVLITILVVAFPAFQILQSRKPPQILSLERRAARNLLVFGVPVVLLAFDWFATGRAPSMLGLDFPVSLRGEIGLCIAAAAILTLIGSSLLRPPGADPAKDARAFARLSESGMLIIAPGQWRVFVPFAFLIGCGTELLFRGFLYCALSPVLGVAGAVIVAALAYGLGHRLRSWGQAGGAVLSAFAFAIAYALTLSLWWLMILHTAVGLFGGWTGYRLARQRRFGHDHS